MVCCVEQQVDPVSGEFVHTVYIQGVGGASPMYALEICMCKFPNTEPLHNVRTNPCLLALAFFIFCLEEGNVHAFKTQA